MKKTAGEIAKKLNKSYYDLDSENELHMYIVGSVGRKTAISGNSDLDILFDLPTSIYSKYNAYSDHGQSALIQDVKNVLKEKYPNTDIRGDGQVVVIAFNKYTVELVPGFKQADDRFKYPDTHDGGSWKYTDPLSEQSACAECENESDGKYYDFCHIIRSWKNHIGVKMGGLLIDTLVFDFFNENGCFVDDSEKNYLEILQSLFENLKNQDKDRSYWYAMGSNQCVYNSDKGKFISKAKKAYNKIKDLTIGGGIKKISYNDVRKCTSLEKLTLREGIETIGSCAFITQPNLKYVVIPKSVKTIGERAFGFELYYPDGMEENYCHRYIDNFKLGVYAGTAGEEYAKTFNIPYGIISEHTHSYTSKVTKPATCTENGVRTYTCECGDSYTETIPATGHNYGDFVVTKSATCTEDGVKTKTCANCNDKITESIPKTGHTSSDWIIDKNAAINVKGSKHKECTVCKKVLETAEIPALPMINIQSANVSVSTNSYVFDNTAKKPSVTVKIGGKALKNGSDYTVSYLNNTKVGTATVRITGKGDYTGTITRNFTINPAKQQIQKLETRYKGFFVDWAQKGSATGYDVEYSVNANMNGAASRHLTANKPDTLTVSGLTGDKTYYVRVRSYTNRNGKVYYGAWSDVKSIKTANNDITKATVSGISTKAFTGKAITQNVTVKVGNTVLKNGTDYTVSYSNNKKVGKATVKITGKGKYGGVITKTFKINPAKQEIQKLTAKSKAFFIDWAQKGSATGYEIQYATNSKFTSAKKVTITNNKTDKTTVSRLSANKKYYVRVRSYTTVKGTKYYGAWSASKSVTTKK